MKRDRELTRLFRQELPVDVQGKKRVLEAVEKSIRIKGRYSYQPGSRFFVRSLPFFHAVTGVSRPFGCFLAHLPSCGWEI